MKPFSRIGPFRGGPIAWRVFPPSCGLAREPEAAVAKPVGTIGMFLDGGQKITLISSEDADEETDAVLDSLWTPAAGHLPS